MTTTNSIPSFQIRDPRCPACGRVVLNPFVEGAEGRYHPACVQPLPAPALDWPPRLDMPAFPNPYPTPYYQPYPFGPSITWGGNHLNPCL